MTAGIVVVESVSIFWPSDCCDSQGSICSRGVLNILVLNLAIYSSYSVVFLQYTSGVPVIKLIRCHQLKVQAVFIDKHHAHVMF